MNSYNMNGMPTGFGMALMQNAPALERFSAMSKAEQEAIINGTHNIKSRLQMQEYVNSIGETEKFSGQ